MKSIRLITIFAVISTSILFGTKYSPAYASSVVLEPVIFNSYYINNYMYSNGMTQYSAARNCRRQHNY